MAKEKRNNLLNEKNLFIHPNPGGGLSVVAGSGGLAPIRVIA
jgi:hypothetical protein